MKLLFSWIIAALAAMTVRQLIGHYCHASSRRRHLCQCRHVTLSNLP